MNNIDKDLLKEIDDLHSIPMVGYNLRINGKVVESHSTEDVKIIPKKDKNGIDVFVQNGTKNKSIHIPVLITVGELNDLVYNDFYIGEDAEILIVAGCGIHNNTNNGSKHDGIHTFHLSKNAKVKYVEKHIGKGSGEKILNPTTIIQMEENSEFEMDTIQLEGVSYSNRNSVAKLQSNAKLIIKEKVLTTESDEAYTNFDVMLQGKKSYVDILSRSVAKDRSKQKFASSITGETESFGHVECDGILFDRAQIVSIPQINALSLDASLVHEAAIGKIAGEQVIKLMSLGLNREDAEKLIIRGYLS